MRDETTLIQAENLPFDGGAVIAASKSGRRPHLAFVMCRFDDRYVVWTVNLQDHRREKRGGFFNGAYFTEPDERAAMETAQAEYGFRCREG